MGTGLGKLGGVIKSFRVICWSALLSGVLGAPVHADAPAADQAAHDFYFGIELDPAASDSARQLFFETGMNCVRLTGGGYGWAAEGHKKVADDFQSRGLKVYMQLGSHYPDGGYLSLTDAYMVDQDGKPGEPVKKDWAMNYSGDRWPQYSYTSQAFRDKLTQDFTTYVGKFADDHNFAGVILHNEPGYFWQQKRIFDYNPTTIADFRKWLAQQNSTIAELNAKWGTSYTTFDEVKPPGLPPESNIAAWMDWRRFNVSAIADFLKWEAGFFQTLRSDIPRTTNLDGPLNNWYGYRCANMQQYSAAMDRVGIDIYPAAYSSRDFVPYSTDMVQGVAQGREGNVLECEAFSPEQWKSFDEKQRAGLLRSELWTMIGHGMSGILVWGFDTFRQPDAKFNDRIAVCRDIAHQAAMIGVKDFRRQKSRVALCVDPDSYLYLNAVEKKPLELTSQLDHEYEGFHAALDDAGFQTDVIFADQLRSQVWKNYDAIVMPSAIMMDDAMAAELKNFVSGGGTLVAAAPFAQMDRWGKLQTTVPSFGLDQLFGCKVTVGVSPGAVVTPQGDFADTNAVALELHGANTLYSFADKIPAITSNTVDKGRAILIAAQIGAPYLDWAQSDVLSGLFADILKEVSITANLRGQKSGLDLSSLADPKGNVLVIATLPVSSGQIPKPVTDAKITYRGSGYADIRGAFAFPPTTVDGGVVRSGPVLVSIMPDLSDKSVTFSPGEITTALPILLTKDAGPLLAVEAPQQMTNGQETDVTVTVYNPSAQAIQGQLNALEANGVKFDGTAPVDVPSYGHAKVVVKIKAQASGPVARVPLTVTFTPNGGSVLKSVPVDIAIQ